ncbi:MAG: hypothetical protein H7836_09425 [Magnetococcus sp. YQC-3]
MTNTTATPRSATATHPTDASSENKHPLIGSSWQETANYVSSVLQFLEDVCATNEKNQYEFFTEEGIYGQSLVLRMIRTAVEFTGYNTPQGNQTSKAGA